MAINNLDPPAAIAHMLQFDSVHGRFSGTVSLNDDGLDVGHGPVPISAERNPEDLDWSHGDLVLDCTGVFNTDEGAARHLVSGAKKLLISALG